MKRLIDVYWKEDLGISKYPVDIEVYANDRPGLLNDILQAMASKSISVTDLRAHVIPETLNDVVSMTISVPDAKVLSDCFADLLGVKGIYSVNRVTH